MPPLQRIRSVFEVRDESKRGTDSYVRNLDRAERATRRAGDRVRGAVGMPRQVKSGDLAQPVGKSGTRFRDPEKGSFISRDAAKELSRSMSEVLKKQNPTLRQMARGPLARANQGITDSAVALEKGVQSGADRFFARVTEAGRQFIKAVRAREMARAGTPTVAPPPLHSMEQLRAEHTQSRQQQVHAQSQQKNDLAGKLRNLSIANDFDTKLSKLNKQRELSNNMEEIKETHREQLKSAKKGNKSELKSQQRMQVMDQKWRDKASLVNFDRQSKLSKQGFMDDQRRQKASLDNQHKMDRNRLAANQKDEQQRIGALHKENQMRERARQKDMRQAQRQIQQQQRQQQKSAQRSAAPAPGGGRMMGGFAGIKQGGFFENLSSGTQGLMTAMSLAEGNVMGLAFSLIFLQFASNKTLAVFNALIGALVLLPTYAIAGAIELGKEYDRVGRTIAANTRNWNDNRQSVLEAIGVSQQYGGTVKENLDALQELARGGYRDVTESDQKAIQSLALLTGDSVSSIAQKFADAKKDAMPFLQTISDAKLWGALPEVYGESFEKFQKKFRSGAVDQEKLVKSGKALLSLIADDVGSDLDRSFGGVSRTMEKLGADIEKSKFGLFEMIEPGVMRFLEGLRDVFTEFGGALQGAAPYITLFAIAVGDFLVGAVKRGVSIIKSLISFVGPLAGRIKEFIDILISAKPELDFDISEFVGEKMNEKLNGLKDRIVEAIKNGTDNWGVALAGAFWAATGFKKSFKGAFALAALAFFGDDLAEYFFSEEQRKNIEDKLKEKIDSWGDNLGYFSAGLLITGLTSGIVRRFALGALAANITKEVMGAITDGLVMSEDDPELKAKTETIANAVENAASAAIFAKFVKGGAFTVGLAAAIAGGISLGAGALTENDPRYAPAIDAMAIGVGVTVASVIGPGIAKKSKSIATGIGGAVKGAFNKVGTRTGLILTAPLRAVGALVAGIGFSLGSSIAGAVGGWATSISTTISGMFVMMFARIAAISGVISAPVIGAIKALWAGVGVTMISGIGTFALGAAIIAGALAAVFGTMIVIAQKLWEGSKERAEFQQSFRDNSSETVRGMAEEWIKANQLVLPGVLKSIALFGSNLSQGFVQYVVHPFQQAITIWRLQVARSISNVGVTIAQAWNGIIGMFSGIPNDAPLGIGELAQGVKGLKIDNVGSRQQLTISSIKQGGDYTALLRRQASELQELRDQYTLIGSDINPDVSREYRDILSQIADPALFGDAHTSANLVSILQPSQSIIDSIVGGINLQSIMDAIADMIPDFQSQAVGMGATPGGEEATLEDISPGLASPPGGPNNLSPQDRLDPDRIIDNPQLLSPPQVINNININLPEGSTIITQDAVEAITNEVAQNLHDEVYRRGGAYLPPVGSQA